MVATDTRLAPWCLERRLHLPRPRRPLRPFQGRQAHRGRPRDRPPGGRSGRARIHPREPGQRAGAGVSGPAGEPPAGSICSWWTKGVTTAGVRTLGRQHHVYARRVGGTTNSRTAFIRHAWRIEVAHGRLGRSRRLAKSFEHTTTSATEWLQSPASRLRCGVLPGTDSAPESRGRGVSSRHSEPRGTPPIRASHCRANFLR